MSPFPRPTCIFVGPGHRPDGSGLRHESTVAKQRRDNVRLRDGNPEEDFVRIRTEREATPSAPVLFFPGVRVNIDTGHLPEPEAKGIAYLEIPLNAFGGSRGGQSGPGAVLSGAHILLTVHCGGFPSSTTARMLPWAASHIS